MRFISGAGIFGVSIRSLNTTSQYQRCLTIIGRLARLDNVFPTIRPARFRTNLTGQDCRQRLICRFACCNACMLQCDQWFSVRDIHSRNRLSYLGLCTHDARFKSETVGHHVRVRRLWAVDAEPRADPICMKYASKTRAAVEFSPQLPMLLRNKSV